MRKTDITKNAIITSTIRFLRENGDVTVKEICDDAGVNIGAINYHFSDKETLIEVVLRRVILDIKTKIDTIVSSSQELTKREIIKQILNVFYAFVEENNNVILFTKRAENAKYLEAYNKYFYHLFSSSSDTAYKVINVLAPNVTNDEEKRSLYMSFFSMLILPVSAKFNHTNGVTDYQLFPINDISFKEKYIDNILKLLS